MMSNSNDDSSPGFSDNTEQFEAPEHTVEMDKQKILEEIRDLAPGKRTQKIQPREPRDPVLHSLLEEESEGVSDTTNFEAPDHLLAQLSVGRTDRNQPLHGGPAIHAHTLEVQLERIDEPQADDPALQTIMEPIKAPVAKPAKAARLEFLADVDENGRIIPPEDMADEILPGMRFRIVAYPR